MTRISHRWWHHIAPVVLTSLMCFVPAQKLAGQEGLAGVSRVDLGPFVIHLSGEPFRWSLHYRGELLFSQRARGADSSLEFLDEGGWQALEGGLKSRAKTSEDASPPGDPARSECVVQVSIAGSSRLAEVKFTWYEWSAGPVVAVSVTHPGASAWRDDLIAPAGNFYFPAPVSAPHPGRAVISRGPIFVLSSGGYGLLLEGGGADGARIFETAPDILRLEVRGSHLRYLVLPGAPKQVLRLRAHLWSSFRPGDAVLPGSPVPHTVSRWKDLREVTHSKVAGALSGRSPPTLVLALDQMDSELALRALQVAALQPEPLGDLAPERFGEREALARCFIKVHSALGPLLKRYEGMSKNAGVGALRPLAIEYPSDPGAWKVDDQWLLGSNLLVAPILKAGATRREVYIPTGNWLDLRNRETLRGPKRVTATAPINAIPLFVKQGAAEMFRGVADVLRGCE